MIQSKLLKINDSINKNPLIKIGLSLFSALLSLVSLISVFGLGQLSTTGQLASLLIYAAIAWLFYTALGLNSHFVSYHAACLSAVFSIASILGAELSLQGSFNRWGSRKAILFSFIKAVGLFVLFYFISKFALVKSLSHYSLFSIPQGQEKKPFRYWPTGKLAFFALWLLIFVCWLPYWFSLFPGKIYVDSYQQLLMGVGLVAPNNHHPMIHTFLIGFFVPIGRFFGSLSVTVALYSVTQMLIMSAIYAHVLQKLKKFSAAFWLRAAVFVYFALFPLNAYYSFMILKDCLYAAFFLLCIIETFDFCLYQDDYFEKKFNLVKYAAILFLTATFRNNGLYAVLFFLPFFLYMNRKYLKKAIAVALSVVVLLMLYLGPFFSLMKISKGSEVEMLSVPLQQIARVVVKQNDNPTKPLTKEQQEKIALYWQDISLPEIYNWRVSDPVKWTFNMGVYEQDKSAFYSFWLEMFLTHPLDFVESYLIGSLGYWYADGPKNWIVELVEINTSTDLFAHYVLPEGLSDVERTPLFPFSNTQKVYDYTVEKPQTIPVIGLFYTLAFYTWMMFLSAVILHLKRQTKLLYPYSMIFMLWFTTTASPVFSEFRYMYGIIITAPVCLAISLAVPPLAAVNKRKKK